MEQQSWVVNVVKNAELFTKLNNRSTLHIELLLLPLMVVQS
jgi:hypothetical protein